MQKCLPDGSGFGACEGAVAPVDEDCSTGVDDDCDGVTNEPDAGCACIPGQIETCYSGADRTRGVGLCKDGLRTCDPSGTEWRACNGEVNPARETCDDATDEDAIAAAEALGGLGVKVGPGASAATLRAPDPAAVRAWLAAEADA